MATISKIELSGSTDGRPTKVAATSTPGTIIHTAASVTGADNYDELWLWACNTDTTARKLTVEWGSTTSPDDTIEWTNLAPEDGLVQIIPGLILQNGLIARAFASSGNVVIIVGYCNRITA